MTANSLTNECSRNFGLSLPFFSLSKSNSQNAHFLFFSIFPAKQHTHQLINIRYFTCRRQNPQTGKFSYPQVPHTTQVMCDGKAAFSSAPLRCVSQEKGSPNLTKRDRCTKVRILTRVGKVRGSFRNQNSFSSDRKHDCNKH